MQTRHHSTIESICEKISRACSEFSLLETVPTMHREDLLPFNFVLRQEYAALKHVYTTLNADVEVVMQSLTDPSTASEKVLQLQNNLKMSGLPRQWCCLIPSCGAFEGLSIAPWLARLQCVHDQIEAWLVQATRSLHYLIYEIHDFLPIRTRLISNKEQF